MLMVSFISLFKINEVNPFPLIFLSSLCIAYEVKLLTNPGTLSLAKEIARFIGAFLSKLAKHEPKDPAD